MSTSTEARLRRLAENAVRRQQRAEFHQEVERAMRLLASPPPAPEPDEYLCPNCVTPWKCNGPHIPQGESTQVDESGSSKRHMRQSINGCVTCPRPWSEHTAAERGEPPASQSGSSEPSVTIRDLEIIVATVLDDTEEGNEIEHQIAERARACSARTASPKGEPASAQAVAPGLDEIIKIAAHALCHGKSCDGGHDGDSICPPHGEAALAFAAAYADASASNAEADREEKS